ncbi:MAG: hypothetical protein NUV80_01235 [Candidatus Berkelbacteria bacterium]|nr:hypothetical protein [Candidatus Berkelbacteria bacterium]
MADKTVAGAPYVTVPLKKFNEMNERLRWLACLEAAGVIDWEGYEEAVLAFNEDREDDEET